MISSGWRQKNFELAEQIDKNGVEDFMNWSVINASMYRGLAPDTLLERDEIVLHFGKKYENLKSGSMIQQYHALLAGIHHGIDLNKVETIVEFGSGIGEMVYAAMDMCPNIKRHLIYDIESVCRIQESRFEKDEIYHAFTFSDFEEFEYSVAVNSAYQDPGAILFISICAISEAPIKIRDMLFNSKGSILLENFILRVQGRWDGIDNIEYFSNIIGDTFTVSPCIDTNHVYLISNPGEDK